MKLLVLVCTSCGARFERAVEDDHDPVPDAIKTRIEHSNVCASDSFDWFLVTDEPKAQPS